MNNDTPGAAELSDQVILATFADVSAFTNCEWLLAVGRKLIAADRAIRKEAPLVAPSEAVDKLTLTPNPVAVEAASGKFRKRPVVIDAWVIDHDAAVPSWAAPAFKAENLDWCPSGEGLWINTLEGSTKGDMGDYLIRGVEGEFYACKPGIFAKTYEAVATPVATELVAAPEEQRTQTEKEIAWLSSSRHGLVEAESHQSTRNTHRGAAE